LDPNEGGRRKRSIGRQLRRLRFRLKKRVYGWLHIPLSERHS
jgi:hypothetical protein